MIIAVKYLSLRLYNDWYCFVYFFFIIFLLGGERTGYFLFVESRTRRLLMTNAWKLILVLNYNWEKQRSPSTYRHMKRKPERERAEREREWMASHRYPACRNRSTPKQMLSEMSDGLVLMSPEHARAYTQRLEKRLKGKRKTRVPKIEKPEPHRHKKKREVAGKKPQINLSSWSKVAFSFFRRLPRASSCQR